MAPPQGSSQTREPSPPPVPPRNPRRVDYLDTFKGRAAMKKSTGRYGTQSSPLAAQTIFEEVERELDDTQQRFVSAAYEFERGGVSLGQKSDVGVTEFGNVKSRRSGEEKSSLLWSTGRQHEVKNVVEGTQVSDFLTDISSYNGASDGESITEEEARVEAWLHRGSCAIPPPEADRVSQASIAPHRKPEAKHHLRSILTSPSSTVSRHGFSSPVSPRSPMNNGRDAYGNFIPTNTRDYLTTVLPSTSPSLRPIIEDVAEPKPQPSPSLRGGGDWRSLGIGPVGKEPSVNKKPSTLMSGSSHRDTPTTTSNTKLPMLAQAQIPSSLRVGGADVHGRGNATLTKSDVKSGSVIAAEYEWSDEDSVEEEHRKLRLSEFDADKYIGSVQDKHRDRFAAPTGHSAGTDHAMPASSNHLNRLNGTYRKPPPIDVLDGAKSEPATLWTGLQPPKRLQLEKNGERSESPTSVTGYNMRLEKRWNKAPSTPPTEQAPPPPPPRNVESSYAAPRYVNNVLKSQYAYQYGEQEERRQQPLDTILPPSRLPSPEGSYYDETWDLQSLQFGESVSVAGGTQRNRQYPVAEVPAQQPSAEEYRAQQLTAQAEFRGLCQDVMKKFNIEISRLLRELQADELTQTQFDRHRNLLLKNKNNSLKHCAHESDYVILQDEHAILEAMKTVNGYAIYHDLLHTTKPASWQRLVVQHIRATNRPATPEKARSSSSSLDRARHATGRIARFLLAAPSDPDLKTYSNRAAPEVNPRQLAIAMPWLNPMAASAFANTSGPDMWISKNKKDKGKRKEELRPTAAQGVSEQDLAHSLLSPASTAPSQLPTATATNSNGHWAGNTTVPSTQVTHAVGRATHKYEVGSSLLQPPAHTHDASLVSEESAWPESDSQGNWFDAKKARLRGGGQSEKKKGTTAWKAKRVGLTPEHDTVKHFLTRKAV